MKGAGRSIGTSIVKGNDEIFSLQSSLNVRANGNGLSLLPSCPPGFVDVLFRGDDPAADEALPVAFDDVALLFSSFVCLSGVMLSSSAAASALDGCKSSTA